jgi:hypothetical protein
MAVMLVQRALIDDEITEKKAGLLLYSIQIAAANVHKTTFGQADAEMVTEIQPEEAAMDAHDEQMEKLKRIEKVKALPLITTEDTDLKTNEQKLPRMDADEQTQEEKTLPLINAEDADPVNQEKATAGGASTPESQNRAYPGAPGCATQVSLAPEVYANQGQTSEVRANLG